MPKATNYGKKYTPGVKKISQNPYKIPTGCLLVLAAVASEKGAELAQKLQGHCSPL